MNCHIITKHRLRAMRVHPIKPSINPNPNLYLKPKSVTIAINILRTENGNCQNNNK